MKTQNLKQLSNKNIVWRYFFIIFLSLGSIIFGIIMFLYNLETKEYLSQIKSHETVDITLMTEIIDNNIKPIISDLKFLSKQNEVMQFIETKEHNYKELAKKEYLEFCRQKNIYDQIRFIDSKGMEIIRINHNNGKSEIVPENILQNKADRYYFKDTFKLGCDTIFVSLFDLNIENKKLEIPFKPIIRFGMPFCDNNNQKQGVIILNYLGSKLLNLIKDSNTNMMLVNSDSYWLYSPIQEEAWGFMIKERQNRKFSSKFPKEWAIISSSDKDQFYNENGLFTFDTISVAKTINELESPVSLGNRTKPGQNLMCKDSSWKLISYIPKKNITDQIRSVFFEFLSLTLLTFVFTTILAWFINRAVVRRKLYQLELYQLANFDKLTNLPNRTLFLNKLNQVHYQSQRYSHKYALLFIDLDGFKQINDTLGHDAGDQVLIEVGERLSKCIRQSDMAARLGGDEFIIILPFIASYDHAQKVSQKIIKEISLPLNLKDGKSHIGASIGISFYPDDGDNPDELLQKADEEMYKEKKKNKKAR